MFLGPGRLVRAGWLVLPHRPGWLVLPHRAGLLVLLQRAGWLMGAGRLVLLDRAGWLMRAGRLVLLDRARWQMRRRAWTMHHGPGRLVPRGCWWQMLFDRSGRLEWCRRQV